MSTINPKDEATRAKLEELLKPKNEGDTVYMRIVNGCFFKHTVTKDGKHTAELLNSL